MHGRRRLKRARLKRSCGPRRRRCGRRRRNYGPRRLKPGWRRWEYPTGRRRQRVSVIGAGPLAASIWTRGQMTNGHAPLEALPTIVVRIVPAKIISVTDRTMNSRPMTGRTVSDAMARGSGLSLRDSGSIFAATRSRSIGGGRRPPAESGEPSSTLHGWGRLERASFVLPTPSPRGMSIGRRQAPTRVSSSFWWNARRPAGTK